MKNRKGKKNLINSLFSLRWQEKKNFHMREKRKFSTIHKITNPIFFVFIHSTVAGKSTKFPCYVFDFVKKREKADEIKRGMRWFMSWVSSKWAECKAKVSKSSLGIVMFFEEEKWWEEKFSFAMNKQGKLEIVMKLMRVGL